MERNHSPFSYLRNWRKKKPRWSGNSWKISRFISNDGSKKNRYEVFTENDNSKRAKVFSIVNRNGRGVLSNRGFSRLASYGRMYSILILSGSAV